MKILTMFPEYELFELPEWVQHKVAVTQLTGTLFLVLEHTGRWTIRKREKGLGFSAPLNKRVLL